MLLVEDSPTVRLVETMRLSEAGCQVEAVGDGAQALARALASAYHLVVAGIEVRGLRGFDLVQALRQSPGYRGVPIILTSCDDRAEHRRLAAEVGAQAYIRKGAAGRQQLVETARALLAGSAA